MQSPNNVMASSGACLRFLDAYDWRFIEVIFP